MSSDKHCRTSKKKKNLFDQSYLVGSYQWILLTIELNLGQHRSVLWYSNGNLKINFVNNRIMSRSIYICLNPQPPTPPRFSFVFAGVLTEVQSSVFNGEDHEREQRMIFVFVWNVSQVLTLLYVSGVIFDVLTISTSVRVFLGSAFLLYMWSCFACGFLFFFCQLLAHVVYLMSSIFVLIFYFAVYYLWSVEHWVKECTVFQHLLYIFNSKIDLYCLLFHVSTVAVTKQGFLV